MWPEPKAEGVSPATGEEWPQFMAWALQEGWLVPDPEVRAFCGPLRRCFFALREEGEVRGFVSAAVHQRSGWIGNLIVTPEGRGRGYGGRLFRHALGFLQSQGVRSVWLTASAQGRPLYRREGFRTIDLVLRWRWERPGTRPLHSVCGSAADLFSEDARAWGESRREVLKALLQGGETLACGGATALLQSGPMRVLGPWYSGGEEADRHLLRSALGRAGPEGMAVDALLSSPVQFLLSEAGLALRGGCDLMVLGDIAGIDLSRVAALASLGSLG